MKEILHGKTIELLTQSKQQMNFGNDQNSRFKLVYFCTTVQTQPESMRTLLQCRCPSADSTYAYCPCCTVTHLELNPNLSTPSQG